MAYQTKPYFMTDMEEISYNPVQDLGFTSSEMYSFTKDDIVHHKIIISEKLDSMYKKISHDRLDIDISESTPDMISRYLYDLGVHVCGLSTDILNGDDASQELQSEYTNIKECLFKILSSIKMIALTKDYIKFFTHPDLKDAFMDHIKKLHDSLVNTIIILM